MRNIVEEDCFHQNAVKVFGSAQDADDALRGVKWVLSREPDFSTYPIASSTPSGPLYAFKDGPAAGRKGFTVYFTVIDPPPAAQIILHDLLP